MDNIKTMILNHIGSSIYVVDMSTYELVYLNQTIKELIGMDEGDSSCLGKKCFKVLQGKDKPCEFCTNHLLRVGEFYEWEYYNQLIGDYFFIKDTMFAYQGRMLRLEIADKATKRVEERRSLMNMLETELALIQCVHTLTENNNQQVAIDSLLKIIAEFYDADRAYIFEIHYESGIIVNTYEWCGRGVEPAIDKLQSVPL